ncbi:OmpH family outer membrane protein [Pontibaca salina]|uniref:OmpH family outer membrane protein n=1 Tax=Pontibaca salina TaxID=2795731 RepID=A0A934M145_9RHOB|nr:OmpH family outer membrane protein [Pontibaca salina]MBI6630403.1 OmpH family outer membrane protein [Pontibaca salina]
MFALALTFGTSLGAQNWSPDLSYSLPYSAILTVAPDRLFIESAYGQRVVREIETEGAALATENRRIESQLMAEEQELTGLRAEMDPGEFRALADAFDQKVQRIRREQDAKARELGEQQDRARSEFLEVARPVLVTLMRESGASVILQRSSVFLSADSTDITDLAVARIDAEIGDGTQDSEVSDQDPQ